MTPADAKAIRDQLWRFAAVLPNGYWRIDLLRALRARLASGAQGGKE